MAEARQILLKSIRKRLGLTQEQMAEALGMSARGYQALEEGQNPVKLYHLYAAKYIYAERMGEEFNGGS